MPGSVGEGGMHCRPSIRSAGATGSAGFARRGGGIVNCPRCGRDNRVGAAFCDGCGHALSTGRVPGGTFVGRSDELLALDEALTRAGAGQGRLFLVGGEPGIGKSRLAQECAIRAAGLGFRVLWGRCLEDPGAPPYWPWLQLLRGWLEAADDEHLEEAVGDDGILLLDLLPELGRRLPGLKQEPPLADATHARFRLFEAVVRLWQRTARRQPLLLVLDNLHAADVASLRLLNFLVPEIVASPMLLFGTWRTSELSRQHPVASTLSELAGHAHVRRLVLGGLERDDADRLLAELSGLPEPPAALAAAVFAHSDGNPLFIRELALTLLQQDLLRPGRNALAEGVQMPIPEGIRDVLRQRVARLSERCAEVLATAAVIGRRFELELLAGLETGQGMPNVLEALDEALGARLIEELAQPGRYQFSHALIRETLYDELPTTRRLRLHREIGEQLAALHADLSETGLSRLAWHFAQAAPLGTATRAVECATRAGGRAEALLAYEESVRFYGMALDLQERYGDGRDADYCHLLLAMGTAQYRAGEYVQAMATFRNAATNARRRGAAEDLARAALGYEEASWRPGLPGTTARQLLQDALAAVGSGNPRLEARLLSALTRALIFTGEVERSREVQQRAVGLARGLDDPALLAGTLCAGLSARWQPERLEERLETAQEAAVLAERAGDWEMMFSSLSWQLFDLLESADMAGLHTALEHHTQLAERLRQPFFLYIGATFRAALALLEGRFDVSEARAREALVVGQRQGLDAAGVFSVQMFSIERERGRLGAIAPLLERFLARAGANRAWRPGMALLYAELGRLDEARGELDRLAADDFAAVPRDGLWVTCLAYLAEVCAALDDAAHADALYEHLLPYAGHNVVAGTTVACYGAADRYLGLLAATRGDTNAAAAHLDAAMALDRSTGARPCLARGQLDRAGLYLAHGPAGDRDTARSLLVEARTTAAELGMATVLERIERLSRQSRLAVDEDAHPQGLSRREVQVLRLLGAGCSNREIATRLFLSPNTVANHVRNILAKTGTSNRTQAAAWARERDLLDA